MKKIICVAMTALLFAGCYDDKGNYDYKFDSMNDINLDSIAFSPKSYESMSGTMIEVQQPMFNDTIVRIDVLLKQTISENYDDLEFMWIRNYQGKGEYNQPVDSCDTVYSVGYVDLPFYTKEDRTYKLQMVITDKTTTLKYYKNLSVKTRPIYKNSLFVLHGENGNCKLGNIELIGDIPKVVTDAYSNVNPTASANPFSEAELLDFSTCLNIRNQYRTLCVFHGNGTANIWEPYGLTQKVGGILGSTYVFNKKWGGLAPRSLIGLGDVGGMAHSKLLINSDGKYYVSGLFFAYIPYDNKLSSSIGHQTDFYISAGTIMKDFLVFWDSDNERFLYQAKQLHIDDQDTEEKARTKANAATMGPLLDAFVDFSSLSEGQSPQGKRAVYSYISAKEGYQQAHPFFIFADTVNGKADYYLYELTPSPTLVDPNKSAQKLWSRVRSANATQESEPMFSITARKLPSLNPGKFATNICYSLSYSTNYIFFIDETGKAVYRYNTMNDELYTVYEAPMGYDITRIKFRTSYFFQETSMGSFDYQRTLPSYLSIAHYNGTNGAGTEVKLDNTGDVDPSFPVVLHEGDGNEKFGKIKDMQFVFGYYND